MGDEESVWQLERICWLDLETTGLDPDKGLLLEVAVVVTNQWLKELARNQVVVHHTPEAIEASGIGDYVRDMHTQNGLLDEVIGRGPYRPRDLSDAEYSLVMSVKRVCGAKKIFLGGASPGSVDRPFLRKYMPKFYDLLYHRSIDATCLSLAHAAWGNGHQPQRENKPHRALADTLATIELARRTMRFMYRGAKLIAREDGKPFVEVFTRPSRPTEEEPHVCVVSESDREQEQEADAVRAVPG